MPNLSFITVAAVIALFAILVIGFIFSSLYKRATKETAFVRTGLGGEKVVKDGGAIVLPVLQAILTVNMQTLRLDVKRQNESALITKDRLRVDVGVAFYLRVSQNSEAISMAAQTLGDKTMDPDALRNLLEDKFVDALRAVASQMELDKLHENRAEFVGKVQAAVAEDLSKNGLELETVSLTSLDQTSKDYFNPDNAFDAEGLYRLTLQTEEKRKQRNVIEQDTAVAIAEKNLEAEQRTLEIGRDRSYAKLDTEREVAIRTETQKTEIEKQRAEQETAAETARAESRRAIREANIQADQKIAIAEADSQIVVANKSEEQSKADAQANGARAEAVRSEEKVVTARETEQAERNKQVAIIKSREVAESDSVAIVVAAEAEKQAATDRADALKITAEADADAERTRASGRAESYKVDAEGKRLLNEAANSLNTDQIRLSMQLELIRTLPAIIDSSVKPAEKIDSIRILQTGGMALGSGEGGATGGSSDGSVSDQIVNGLLKYRGQAPLVDLMLETLGFGPGGDISAMTAKIAKQSGFETPAIDNTAPVSELETPVIEDVETVRVPPQASPPAGGKRPTA